MMPHHRIIPHEVWLTACDGLPFFLCVATGQDWPTGDGPYGDWLYKFSDALTAKGIDHDASEEEGDIHGYKHGHYVGKMRLRNNHAQLLEAGRWGRTLLGMGTGPGQVPGKIQFKLVTAEAGGLEGVRQYIFKDSDKLGTMRFRWTTNRGTSWDQVDAWGAEWRRTYGCPGFHDLQINNDIKSFFIVFLFLFPIVDL